jgi:hypothetical protein
VSLCWKKLSDAWVLWVVLGSLFGSLLVLLR